jgi:hypothetical protein
VKITLPKHELYYVITARNVAGPRSRGEVMSMLDGPAFVRNINALVDQGCIAPVPWGSLLVGVKNGEVVEADFEDPEMTIFVNEEFAQLAAGVSVEPDPQPEPEPQEDVAADKGADDVDPTGGVDIEALRAEWSKLNKADLIAAVEPYGASFDAEAATKAEIIEAVTAHIAATS